MPSRRARADPDRRGRARPREHVHREQRRRRGGRRRRADRRRRDHGGGDDGPRERPSRGGNPRRSPASRRIRTGITCCGTRAWATRPGTARAAAMRELRSTADWEDPRQTARVRRRHPDGAAGSPLPAVRIPWGDPYIEHQAHCAGPAALLIVERGARRGGLAPTALDPRLSDTRGAERVALHRGARTFRPADRIAVAAHDLIAYEEGLRGGDVVSDPRIGSAAPGCEWVSDIHEWQVRRLARVTTASGRGGARCARSPQWPFPRNLT